MKKYIFDIECYENFFLIMFKNIDDGEVKYLQMHDGVTSGDITDRIQLKSFMEGITSIGFNSLNYDMPMIAAYIKQFSNKNLKEVTNHIIALGDPHWKTTRKFNLPELAKLDHIDLKEACPGGMTSLKIYGARANATKLQDLPIEPDAIISSSQAKELRDYCINDLDTTLLLYKSIEKQIILREDLTKKYGVDMRSKSDSQIAEAIIKNHLESEGVTASKRVEPVGAFKYRVPDWVKFEGPEFDEMLERVRTCEFGISDKGRVVMPKVLNKKVEYDGASYKFGIGGLHSQEKRQVIVPNSDELLGEFDVTSMYPSVIIEQELFPLHLTRTFLDVYSDIKATRLEAKRIGDKVVNDTFKIVLNGSYGKFGSKYSFLYSPELLIQTTITGQLSLLMLIEKMTLAGGRVVSANTDSVNVLYSKADHADVHSAQFDWELTTGYELEYTPYRATYARDVNAYIAITDDGVKGKGAFALGGLMKNPTNNVCIEAVIAFLTDGADIETHIRNEKEATKFLTVRTVTGGAIFRNELLGKAIRFYHSTAGDVITYKKNGNKVPKSDGCKPLMNISTFPTDINFDWYVEESKSILKALGLNA